VRVIRSSRHLPRYSRVYEPGILIIAQGRKIVYLGDEIYKYDANNYLVITMPLPMECETISSPDEPLLGVGIKVDPVMISELLIEMDSITPISGSTPRGIYSSGITKVIIDALIRLLECLSDPVDGRVLGPQIAREIVYRILCGEQGEVLRLLAIRHGRFSQMAKVLNRIHMSFNTKLDIATLADEASMSVSSFHSNFKAVTNTSPIQYIKKFTSKRQGYLWSRMVSMPSTQPLKLVMKAPPCSAGNLNATSDMPLQRKLSGCGILSGRLRSARRQIDK